MGECDIEPTLRPDALEQAWSRLLMAQQERERDLTDEIRRLERLQRLAEKLHRYVLSQGDMLKIVVLPG